MLSASALRLAGCALLLLVATGQPEDSCGAQAADAFEDDASALLSVAAALRVATWRSGAAAKLPASSLPLRHKGGLAPWVPTPSPHERTLLRCEKAHPGDATCFDTPPPPEFRVKFALHSGESFVVRVVVAWARVYAQRFWQLVNLGWWDGVSIYRNDYINSTQRFMSQFGISPNPIVNTAWDRLKLSNLTEPALVSNTRGKVTFAMGGVECNATAGATDPCALYRSSCNATDYCAVGFDTEVFVNYGDNSRLDSHGFAPFGEVEGGPEGPGMEAVDSVGRALGPRYGEVTDLCPEEQSQDTRVWCVYRDGARAGVDTSLFQAGGNSYVESDFPGIYAMRISTTRLLP